jgi:MarR family transcriptional regulator for hemolysin
MGSFKYEKADESPGFLLWKITSLWQKKLNEIFSKFEITQTQYAILASLKWFEEHQMEVTQGLLVEHTKIDKMTISKAIRGLEAAKFLKREKSEEDSRSMEIRFTHGGREKTIKAISDIENADEVFFGTLSKEELKSYKALTLKLINQGLLNLT